MVCVLEANLTLAPAQFVLPAFYVLGDVVLELPLLLLDAARQALELARREPGDGGQTRVVVQVHLLVTAALVPEPRE
jgi:hypothetical protein